MPDRERILDLDRGYEVRAESVPIERQQDVRRDDAGVGEVPAQPDRGIVDVVALDLEEERHGNRIGLRGELVAAEEHDRRGERMQYLRGRADGPPEHAAADVVG